LITVAITSTLTAVLAGGQTRGFVRITNDGPNIANLSYDGDTTPVTAAIGMPLGVGSDIDIPSRPSTQFPVTAICAASETSTLRIQGL